MTLFQRFRKLFDPIDMTKGPILKVMIPFLIPIILSMVFQQLYSLTDSIIVGKTLNSNEITGVNDVVSMTGLVLNFTIGCTAGFSVILAKAVGAKDPRKTRQSFFVQILLGILCSLVLTLIFFFLIDPLLSWINIRPSDTDPNLQEIYLSARTYLRVMYLFGILSQMMYNLFVSILRGIGDSFVPFLFLVLSTFMNIGLDLIFIVVFRQGVLGSAVATVLSQALAAISAFIYTQIRYKQLRFVKEDCKFGFRFVYEHLRLGIPLGFQWSILFIGIVIQQAAVIPFDFTPEGFSVIGNPCQIGYGIACKTSGFLMVFFSAIGNGLLAFASQCSGAKEYKRMKDGFKVMTIMTVLVALCMMALGFLLIIQEGYQHIFLASDKISEGTIRYGNTYLFITLPFFIPLGLIYIGRNFMQAVEKPFYPFLSGIVELLGRSLICLFLPAIINHGPINSEATLFAYGIVCAADPITWVLSCITVMIPSLVYLKQLPKAEGKPISI